MKTKELLMKQIEREQTYCDNHDIGSDEYKDSFKRLTILRKELADLEKTETEDKRKNRELVDTKKDRRTKNTIEAIKVIGGGIVMPAIGYVVLTAFEKEDSFTSSLKKVVDCFIPKRMN